MTVGVLVGVAVGVAVPDNAGVDDGVAVGVAVGVGVAPSVGVWEGVNVGVAVASGGAASPTTTDTVELPVRPAGSVTVSFTLYVPAAGNVLPTIDWVELLPSGNSHLYASGSFCGSREAEPSKVTASGGVPVIGEVLMTALGAVFAGGLPDRVN